MMRKRSFIFIHLLVTILGLSYYQSFAGSNAAYLKGKSESGRTKFECTLQDVTAGLISARFEIDGFSIHFDENDEANVIYDLNNQVFCIYLKGKNKMLNFWVLPKSIQKQSGDWFRGRFIFRAKVYGTEPRSNKDLFSPETVLNCTFVYEV